MRVLGTGDIIFELVINFVAHVINADTKAQKTLNKTLFWIVKINAGPKANTGRCVQWIITCQRRIFTAYKVGLYKMSAAAVCLKKIPVYFAGIFCLRKAKMSADDKSYE